MHCFVAGKDNALVIPMTRAAQAQWYPSHDVLYFSELHLTGSLIMSCLDVSEGRVPGSGLWYTRAGALDLRTTDYRSKRP